MRFYTTCEWWRFCLTGVWYDQVNGRKPLTWSHYGTLTDNGNNTSNWAGFNVTLETYYGISESKIDWRIEKICNRHQFTIGADFWGATAPWKIGSGNAVHPAELVPIVILAIAIAEMESCCQYLSHAF